MFRKFIKCNIPIVLQLILITNSAWSYNWPFNSSVGQQHPINATLGEYRGGSKPHFHDGVDMNPKGLSGDSAIGTAVYAIEGGTCTVEGSGDNERVICGNYKYWHVNGIGADGKSVDGKYIKAGKQLAKLKALVAYPAHLHLIENSGGSNPLRSDGGLSPYIDTSTPTIKEVKVVKQGSGEEFPKDKDDYPIVSGQVDIKVNAWDSQQSNGGSSNVAPYKIGYEIRKEDGTVVENPPPKIEFNTISGYKLVLVYAEGSTQSNYIYWATNRPTANEFWDTEGLPGGHYTIKALVEDIIGNKTETAITVVKTSPPTSGFLSVTPTDGLTSSGNQGGPFTPSSKAYTLQNTGGTSINWTASKGQSWVNLSSTSGSLAPDASTVVTVSINSNANSLTSSVYGDTVSFTNTTNSNGNATRPIKLTVNAIAPTITVTSPNGGENWQRGSTYEIKWTSNNAGSNVKIELWKGGSTIWTITSSTSNDNSYSWMIPSDQAVASDYKIRITDTSNSSVWDESNNYLSITSAPPITRTLTVASSNPNNGVNITVSPNDNNGQGNGITQFTRTYNNNTVVTLTAPSTAGGNNFQKWQRNGTDYLANSSINITMDANYTMTAVYVTTVQPPTVETWSATDITTTAATINAEIANNGGANIDERRFSWGKTSSCSDGWVTDNLESDHYGYIDVSGNNFSCNLVGLTSNTTYYFQPWAHNSSNIDNGQGKGWGCDSALSFTTSSLVITVTSPNGGENWQRGSTYEIKWTSSNAGSNVKIELYKGGSFNRTITSITSNDGSYSWTIPGDQAVGSDYKIRITDTSNSSVWDETNSNFSITSVPVPTITVTSPNGGENWQRGSNYNITWTSSNAGSNVKIELWKGGSTIWTITSSTSNDNSYSWMIPSDQAVASDYKIRITDTSNSSTWDESNSNFSITSQETGALNVTIEPVEARNAGAQWRVDEGSWHSSGDTQTDLFVGQHTVEFSNISGWTKPDNKSTNIVANQTTSETGIYTQIIQDSIIYVSTTGNDNNSGTDQNYPKGTIQAGVNACPIDGTVSVSAGTYAEEVTINKRIAVVGVGTPTIDPPANSNAVTFNDDNANNASISGFRITGATGNGNGGIYCDFSSPTITNNTISGNSEYGIVCNSSSPTINNNTISGNGYGIYCDSSSPTITNNTISGNRECGIRCNSSSPTIKNNTISGNTSYGIRCDFSSPTISNNTISGNGHGIFCYNSSSPTITNNTISGNSNDGISCYRSSSPTITNNTISGNRGNGFYCYSSSPTINNNIITENGTTNPSYYGIYVYVSTGTPTIDHNCVWENGPSGTQNYFNCTQGLHDISANPQFIGGSDFHLQSISPCIDTGSNTAPGIPSTDKDGNPRIIRIVDMGAYEFQGTPAPSVPSAVFFGTPTSGTKPLLVQFTDQSTGSITTWLWQFGDGNTSTTQSPTHTYTTVGTYTVSLTVMGPGGSNTLTKADYIVVTEPSPVSGSVTVYDVSGNFIGTYTTIQAGVNACPVGGTVSVAAGTYTEAVYINKRITLVGVGTPTITAAGLGYTNTVTFDGTATNGAIISEFMITGAKGTNSNGIICNSSSPSITNNTISGNGNGIICNSSSPSITNNTITGNSQRGIDCYSSFPSITNNTISGNSYLGIYCASSSPTITNNTILGNSYWGIYCASSSSPTITNNTISGNNDSGIGCWSSSPTITNNTISGNGKSGIFCCHSTLSITNNTISGNSDYGIDCWSSVPTITNNTIWNSDEGIFCHSSSPTITNNTISGNSIHGISCQSSSPTITNNTISGNSNGISCCLSSLSITITSPTITITNNIISRNSCSGIYCSSSSTITNNIITENGTSANYYGIINDSGTPTINYNCVWGNGLGGNNNYLYCSPGLGDISFNPKFIGEGDFHLQSASPCIDAGSNTAPGIPATDKDDNPRIIRTVDMGAYEYQGTLTERPVVVYNSSGETLGSYSIIQIGINNCPIGGTVFVGHGTYTEEAVYINKRIALIGSETPTIDASMFSNVNVVTFDGTSTNGAMISGFIITGATGTFPNGNGIYCKNGSSPTITNNTISGNNNDGIFCWSSSPTITNNTISGNNDNGIFCSSSSSTITNNTISGNSRRGIYCGNSSGTITNNTISGNGNDGIACYNSFSLIITNNTISGNNDEGIGCSDSSPTITNNTISGNSYGIYCYVSSPTIANNTISGNNDDGIYCYDSSPTITNNTISGNGWNGIYCYNSSPTITNNTISGNNNYGISCSDSSGTITNNTISGNNDDGIHCSSSSPTITNNTISGNSGEGIYMGVPLLVVELPNTMSGNNDDGIYCSNSSPTIANNTISGNNDNGIYCDDSSGIITNNIITENGTPSTSYYGIYVSSGTLTISYNCVWGNGLGGNSNYRNCSPGQGDISFNPQFIGGGDYHLGLSSPCIDAGSSTATGISSTDKDGNPRIANGIIDMGAYEFQGTGTPSAPSANFSGTPTSGTKPLLVQFTDQSTGSITTWLWEFGDGNTSTEQSPAHTYTTAGTYTVSLTVEGPGGNSIATKTDYIVVIEDTVAPVTTDDALTNWQNATVTVTLTVNDNLSGASRTYYSLNGGAVTAGTTAVITTEGTTTLNYYSTDDAGNIEATKTATVRIDRTLPTTQDNAPAGWRNATVTVTLTATDSFSGASRTYYSLNGGAVTEGTTAVITKEGTNTLEYYSTDIAGNIEATKTATVRIDRIPALTTDNTSAGWQNATVTVTLMATDNLSGASRTYYSLNGDTLTESTTAVIWEEGTNTLAYYSTDNAGNIEATKTATVKIDQTPAVTTDNAPTGWHNSNVVIALSATDTLSGVAQTYYTTDGSTPATSSATGTTITLTTEGTYTIKYFSVDKAGNTEAIKTATNTVMVDKTPPVITISIPSANSSILLSTKTTVAGSITDIPMPNCGTVTIGGTSSAVSITGESFIATDTTLCSGRNVITVSIMDKAGNIGSKTIIVEVVTAKGNISTNQTGGIETTDGTKIEILKEYSGTMTSIINNNPNRANFAVADQNLPKGADISELAEAVREFKLFEEGDATSGTSTGKFRITIPYPVTIPDDKAKELKIFWMDTDNNSWKLIGGTVDTTKHTVTVEVDHLSIYRLAFYTIAKDLSDIRVYPNPFRPENSTVITFDQLSEDVTIKIFNMAGELVDELSGTGKVEWDTKNSSGEEVASGIYVYLVTDKNGKQAVGKFAIIK